MPPTPESPQPMSGRPARPKGSLREARELWGKVVNQLVLLLTAISANLEHSRYGAAQEQLDAANLLIQRASDSARLLIQTGHALDQRIKHLEKDPVIAAILVLDPQLRAFEKFEGEVRQKLEELRELRSELEPDSSPQERSDRLLKRQLAERLILGIDRGDYLPELGQILGIDLSPQSLLILPTKDL